MKCKFGILQNIPLLKRIKMFRGKKLLYSLLNHEKNQENSWVFRRDKFSLFWSGCVSSESFFVWNTNSMIALTSISSFRLKKPQSNLLCSIQFHIIVVYVNKSWKSFSNFEHRELFRGVRKGKQLETVTTFIFAGETNNEMEERLIK